MINNNYNFGLTTGITHIKLTLTNGKLTVPENQFITVTYNDNLTIYAKQDISIAFSQNNFNSNYTPTTLSIQLNPTYVSQTDTSYSISGDACDLLIWRPLEKGYGIQLPLNNTSTYNIDIIVYV